MLTWHVVMHKVEGRAAAYFIADKGSTGAHQARVMGHAPPQVYCLLPTGQQALRRTRLQQKGRVPFPHSLTHSSAHVKGLVGVLGRDRGFKYKGLQAKTC